MHKRIFVSITTLILINKKKIAVTKIECKKKTFKKLKLKNDLGFTFSPIENNNNSTPILDGTLNILFVSDKLIYEKKNPEVIKPIRIGKDKTLKRYPNTRAPLNQIKTVSISRNIH
tara:strand:- start:289 stop:636 length:348 start_codon:yes stop_codon:yes gene_type:complete